MRTRHLSATAIVAAAVLALAACSSGGGEAGGTSGGSTSEGGSTGGASGPVELDYWSEADSGPPLATWKGLVADFNSSHPDINVKLRTVSNASFFTVMRNAFTANDPPEIFQHEGNTNLFQFVTEGGVTPITDWFNKPGNGDRFTQGSPVASVTYDGEVYGIPLSINVTQELYYSKSILAGAGIDPTTFKTWDDFLAAFDQLKAAGITPIAYGNSEGWPGSQWFYAFLGRTAGAKKVNQLVSRNCGYKWTDPDIVQAAQLYTDLSDKGYFSDGKSSDDSNTAQSTFLSGKAAFFGFGDWFIPSIAEAPNPDDYAMVEIPEVPEALGKGSAHDGLINAGGIAVSTAANTPEKLQAALTFLDWVSQPEQQKRQAAIGAISAVPAANDPSLQGPLITQLIADHITSSTGSYPFIEHVTPKAVGEDAIWQGSVAVLTGQATPQSWMESVESAAAAADPIIRIPEDCS